jgi:hypothetical protein
MEPEMKSTNSQTVRRSRDADLDSRYGAIGISAVAAAVRYTGETKSAEAQAVAQPDEKWLADIAA